MPIQSVCPSSLSHLPLHSRSLFQTSPSFTDFFFHESSTQISCRLLFPCMWFSCPQFHYQQWLLKGCSVLYPVPHLSLAARRVFNEQPFLQSVPNSQNVSKSTLDSTKQKPSNLSFTASSVDGGDVLPIGNPRLPLLLFSHSGPSSWYFLLQW